MTFANPAISKPAHKPPNNTASFRYAWSCGKASNAYAHNLPLMWQLLISTAGVLKCPHCKHALRVRRMLAAHSTAHNCTAHEFRHMLLGNS
jgi:hypothetical protein